MTATKFKKPPLVELVIGLQCSGMPFTNEIINEFYNQFLKTDYPTIQEGSQLPTIIEQIESPSQRTFLSNIQSRKLFVSTNGEALVQIQSNRLLCNWRKSCEQSKYPHFDNVHVQFTKIQEALSKLSELPINQLEVTYVDHIEADHFLKYKYDTNEIMNCFRFKSPFSGINSNFVFPQPELNGNLHLIIQSATRDGNKNAIIRIESTCRGYSKDGTQEQWLNKARLTLVEFFQNMFSDEIKNKWEPL